MTLVGALSAQADEPYAYLVFEMNDGTKASVPASSLTLTFSGTTLTAGTQQFTLTNLKSMYFSASNESTTGIGETDAAALDEATEIYDLKGHRVTREQMRRGVYIVKTKKGTSKIVVK